MTYYALRSSRNNDLLFEGRFLSFVACLEQAVRDRISLPHLDLSRKNLSNANLDDAILPDADFTQTNLSGVNLSESTLKGARFHGAALYNACLADSNLTGCDFQSASFGGTDIHNTILSQARFSTLSCFSLDFTRTRHMGGCLFVNSDGSVSKMSRPPLVIKGLGHDPVIVLDEEVRAGHNRIDHTRLAALAQKLSTRELRRRLSSGRF